MSEVTSSIELYDSDVLAIEEALKPINAKIGSSLNLEAFRKEIIERFAEQGFAVDVKVWDTNQYGVYAFDLDITGRVEVQDEFDHERQSHEVVNDLLDIDPSRKGEKFRAPNNKTTPSGIIIKGNK